MSTLTHQALAVFTQIILFLTSACGGAEGPRAGHDRPEPGSSAVVCRVQHG